MHALQGVGVLVTRPAAQAETLCGQLQERGAQVWRLPALDIIAAGDARALAQQLARLPRIDLVIFTSANAVRFGAQVLHIVPAGVTLAAIGPATARALQSAGQTVVTLPQSGFDSESLLAQPRFAHVHGQRIVIVKGIGGREVLAAELSRRGAEVITAEVYERRPSRPDEAQLRELAQRIAHSDIHVVTATSLDIATRLLAVELPELRTAYERVHWVVPSTRVADGIRRLGCGAPQILAVSAEDHDLVSAIVAWRRANPHSPGPVYADPRGTGGSTA